jgi:hypothetical protein
MFLYYRLSGSIIVKYVYLAGYAITFITTFVLMHLMNFGPKFLFFLIFHQNLHLMRGRYNECQIYVVLKYQNQCNISIKHEHPGS